jgi:hypothetical protein
LDSAIVENSTDPEALLYPAEGSDLKHIRENQVTHLHA